MRIIGVIDLKDGQAVHARGGHRESYAAVSYAAGQAINGDPVALARVYLERFGIQDVYIADLNAIESAVPQHEGIRAIGELGARVYVDSGVTTLEGARQLIQTGAHIVVGLETLRSFDVLRDINSYGSESAIFSLDLRDGALMNTVGGTVASPEQAVEHALATGVTEIIVLDVARVGATTGPDMQMLDRIRTAGRGAAVLAGGGVRGLDDLKQIAALGCDGALVATAVHDGRLTKSDVADARLL